MKRNIAILLGAGQSKRFSGSQEIPKQFFKIFNKTILEHTVSKFNECELIDEIYVVINKEVQKRAEEILKNKYGKFIGFIEGGKERFFSSYNAIKFLENNNNSSFNVLLHDIARPNIKIETITSVVNSLKNNLAVVTALQSKDTVYIVDKFTKTNNIPNRSEVLIVQTPQGFDFNILKIAFKEAEKNNDYNFTDDASIVNKYIKDINIAFVVGSSENIKITYKEDLELLKFFMKP